MTQLKWQLTELHYTELAASMEQQRMQFSVCE